MGNWGESMAREARFLIWLPAVLAGGCVLAGFALGLVVGFILWG